MHFGEYELSPSLIGLSPPPSAHPEAFQRLLVRPSTWCYPSFSLAKGRSLGFASAPPDSTPCSDSLSLRLRESIPLTSPGKTTRRFIMQKARRHCKNAAPTACRHMVSGSVSLPCSGCFSPFPHGTGPLSVSREYLALPDGPGGFTQDSSCPALLRGPLRFTTLRVRGCHPLWPPFPGRSARDVSCDHAALQPRPCRDRPGLGSSPVARHYWGNHSYFLFLRVLRCFSSPRWPPRMERGWHPFRMPGCPIRTPADQWPFAPTRGFSQLITSFIASESQGIRHVPFFAFPKGRTYAACFCTRAGIPGYARMPRARLLAFAFLSQHVIERCPEGRSGE